MSFHVSTLCGMYSSRLWSFPPMSTWQRWSSLHT